MKRFFLIITLFLFACSDSSDDSSDMNNPNNGSDGQLVNLFFSEYAEGSSSNKYVEIYNHTEIHYILLSLSLYTEDKGKQF